MKEHDIQLKTHQNSTVSRPDKKGKIVFTGGGTGGHIYPNLALAYSFENVGYTPIYIGGKDSLEQKLAKQNHLTFYDVNTIKFVRSISAKAIKNNVCIPHVLNQAVKQATDILTEVKPLAIISKGGFVSLPCVLAGHKLNIPVFAHESDLSLGLANKIAKHKGAVILKANPLSTFDGVFVGMPLRASLFYTKRDCALNSLGIKTDKKILLVLGGSLGAQILNDAVKLHFDELCKRYFVLHISGKGKQCSLKNNNYKCFEYADDISQFYACADIVVSRAGATSVFELSALQKRALFVPLPKGISRGDQLDNAKLAKSYGGNVLLQDDVFFDNFLTSIQNTVKNPPMRKICEDANGKIVEIVCDSLSRGEKCKDKKLSQNGWR